MEDKIKNVFYERLKSYEGKQVTYHIGTTELKGKLIYTNFMTLNFIIEKNEKTDYVIRGDTWMEVSK